MSNKIIRLLAENDFAYMRGLNISGSVPPRQDAINTLLSDLLLTWSAPGPIKAEAAFFAEPDLLQFLRLVQKLAVRVDTGVIHIDFEVRA